MIKACATIKTFFHLYRDGLCLAVFLLTFNNLINFLPSAVHDRIYIWINLVILSLIWFWSLRYLNLSNLNIGWRKEGLEKSLLLGFGLASIVIVSFVILLFFRSIIGLNIGPPQLPISSRADLLCRVIFRIPLGTAFFEEMLFRGIFYGYMIQKATAKKTIVVTSLFFALWHITPAFKTVRYNFQIGAVLLGVGFWIIFLMSSFIAGILFAWVRYRSKNITGSVLAHMLINDLALLIMFLIWK